MPDIRVAVIGVGNCASALIQGCYKYSRSGASEGLMAPKIGPYVVSDLRFVVGFDVDARKIGLPLQEAIFQKPNCCYDLCKKDILGDMSMQYSGPVFKGPVLDGVAGHMDGSKDLPNVHPDEDHRFKVDPNHESLSDQAITELLQTLMVDVIVNYLPVGSQKATEYWAQKAIDLKIPFVNCIPVFIASDPVWSQKFHDAGVPMIGDDMRSQFGASVLSQMLEELALTRGHKVLAHIQQNVGGNTDFLNMKDETRLSSKKISKENVLQAPHTLYEKNHDSKDSQKPFLFAGPSDYIEYYGDNKVATIRLELEGFGGSPVTLDARLSVQDSPNSAGVVIDAIRYVMTALRLGRAGPLLGPSAFTQKSPPKILTYSEALESCKKLAACDRTFDVFE